MDDRQKKIIIMSKLAVYDKGRGKADRRADRLYRRDFIYRRNMLTRLYAAVVVAIGLVCYWVYRYFTTDMDLFNLDLEPMLAQALYVLGAALIFFTVAGTIKSTADYQSAQARLSRYYKLLGYLDRVNKHEREERDSKNGTGASGAPGSR